MTGVNLDAARRRSLRLAAIGALVFSVLFAVHHVLQAPGPADSSPAEVAAYNVSHQAALL